MTHKILVAAVLAGIVAGPCAYGQKPVIQSGGVVNAASQLNLFPAMIAPQMLVTIRGENLATSTAIADVLPLPQVLAGATVTFNGIPAPLLYASSVQINAQVPSGLAGLLFGSSVNVVVSTPSGASDPVPVDLTTRQLGVFTQEQNGCGQAVAFNIHSDGRPLDLNTPQTSFDPQNDVGLAIFLTGLGTFADRFDGVLWNYNPADNQIVQNFRVMLGAPSLTPVNNFSLGYLGPAPYTAGADQLNTVGNWSGAPRGCRVPMYLTDFQVSASQLVDISIQDGGGACADPPDGTLGIITFSQVLVNDVSNSYLADNFTARFFQGNGLSFAPPGPPDFSVCCAAVVQPTACSSSLPAGLDAGTLTISGLDAAVQVAPINQNGANYQTVLAPGSLKGGTYQVAAEGGSQIEAFTATAQVPAPINIITNLSPGTKVIDDTKNRFLIRWTGGDDSSTVYVQVIIRNPNSGDPGFQIGASVLASAGSITIDGNLCEPFFPCTPLPSGEAEVIVTQSSSGAVAAFSAPGLAKGGQLQWSYVFDYRGLIN